MRRFIQIVEAAQAPLLYHTTSAHGATQILQDRMLRHDMINKDVTPFVSFSEVPLIGNPDIAANDVSIGFHPYAFWGRIEPVIYSEAWFDANPEAGAYIAGEGWSQQWEAPEDAYDDEGFENEDVYQQAYRDAELDAFLDKASEHEWISRHPREPLRFNPDDVVVLLAKDDLPDWRMTLGELGYRHVAVTQHTSRA